MTRSGAASGDPRAAGRDRTLALASLGVVLLWSLAAALEPAPWIIDRFTTDDTYLALQVARGWAGHGFPTFDGIHRTNGFQALWGLLTWLLAEVFPAPMPLLRSTLICVALLNFLAGFQLWHVGRSVFGSSTSALWITTLWCAFCLAARPAMIGLDNALIPPIAAAALLAANRIQRTPRSTRAWLALAALLALGVWSRLDTIVIAGVAWAGFALYGVRARMFRQVLAGSTLLMLALVALAAFNLWAGGTPTPISGMVKRMIAVRIEPSWSPAVVLAAGVEAGRNVIQQFAYGIGGIWPRWLTLITIGLVLLAPLIAFLNRTVRPTRWAALWLVALLVHAFVLRLWLGWYHAETLWYYAVENVAACVLVGHCLGRLAEANGWRRGWAFVLPGFRFAPAALALFVAPSVETGALDQFASARWLAENTRANERVAAWNAGHVAYFSDRTVINLDGLVNDRDYLQLLRSGRAGEAYLGAHNVTWVVDRAQGALDNPGTIWGWLPLDRWEIITRIGEVPDVQQLVVRRISEAPGGASQPSISH